MRATTRIATTTGAFLTAGVAAKILSAQQTKRRKLRRGEDVAFGSVHSARRTVVASDGIRLNVEIDEPDEDTSLPTIVFVHGVLCTLDTWHYQRLALRGQVRMVFMDQRSHGGSDAADRESSTIENLADDLRAVVEACTSGPVVLVGHSMGGMTVMQLAADHPELFGARRGRRAAGGDNEHRVVGVALVSTSGGRLFVSNPGLRRLVGLARAAAPLVDWGRGFNSYSVVRRWALGPHAQAKHVDMTNEMVLHAPTRVLTDFHPMFAALDLRDALQSLSTIRTIVVCGTHDVITPLSHSRRIAEGIAGSSLVICEDIGHMAMFEDHARVTELVFELAEKTARS